ncbi:hypothetical protein MGG_15640 [Pyricularia oryzae 70-15]|uniref:Uncharacterized protein n=3 Tax=Pyricularia oryzae TaxID=318829 RepID=G4MWZ6_PYRO7|nr:uncharacterized protein MGG_15640 [Pyricularia oryzae 70-15]EHA54288.1 hypothetical protein MGG_15640 [Pyricularia oryzae 70-15]ELQ43007.1 hypothetical protein OOU_Y34scaffold00177g19 [Pyricularia oryzae Y34]
MSPCCTYKQIPKMLAARYHDEVIGKAVRIAEGAISVGAGPVQKTTNYHGYLASHLRPRCSYQGTTESLPCVTSNRPVAAQNPRVAKLRASSDNPSAIRDTYWQGLPPPGASLLPALAVNSVEYHRPKKKVRFSANGY